MRKKPLHGQPDVPRDLAKQDSCASLATECGENGDDFARLENGTGGHWLSGHDNDLRADKLALRRRSAVV